MKRWPTALALLVLLACAPAAAQDFSQVEITSQRLGDGLFMLRGAGGNIGLFFGPDAAFMVDDQYAPLTDKIRAAASALGVERIQFVLNTHWHGDHTGGNEKLGGTGAWIVAHDNVRERMGTEQFIKALDLTVQPSSEGALPVVTFREALTFHLNGEEIHAFHVPAAHTDGDTIVQFRGANVLHMGDVFWSDAYPFIDVSSGGSIDGMIAAVRRALGMADGATKVVPGHGTLSDRAGLIFYRDMLESARKTIARLVGAGLSMEEIQAATPTAALDERWGGGFITPERFVTSVVDSLQTDD